MVSVFFIFTASASVSLFSSASDPNELTDGVYNIVNVSTGQYLDVYDVKHDPNGSLYLYKKTNATGQDFLIRRQDDGTYLISPQSEKGLYSLCYESDIMEGEFISKTTSISNQNRFSIVQTENDPSLYNIKPACMTDDKLALTVTTAKGKYNYVLAGLALQNESAEQQWKFVKVSSATLNISGGYVDVKGGKVHDMYAKLTPSHLTGNLTWESSNPEIAAVDSDGRVYGVSEGQTTVTVTCGTKSASAIINVSARTAYTWYSQHNMYSGGWFASDLKNLYITTSGGAKKQFFISGYRTGDDWMDEGCKLCSEAMVLHNLGATMAKGYDMRSGKENNLEADPFTVALANSGLSGKSIASARAYLNPVLVSNGMITSRFTVNGKALVKKDYSGNNLKKIKELLDQHPEGVIVGMYNSVQDSTHYFVFTECLNPDAPKGNYEFRVCDSASSDPKTGDNVPFKQCLSAKTYNYSCIFGYSVYEIVE